jgi:DNA-binding transcriptional LysR family regulator
VLTQAGETYYAGCRRIVERYVALEDEIRTMNQEPAGRLRVASIYSVGLHYMNLCLKRFMTAWPKVNVRLEYQHPCHPKHRLAAAGVGSLDDLDGEKLIGFDPSLMIRREIDRVLDQHGVAVEVTMEFDNIETIKRAVEIDAGVALLPEPTVMREVQAGLLAAVRLPTDELKRPIGIIHRRGKELGKAARRFIELLQDDLPKSTHQEAATTLESDARATSADAHAAAKSNGHGGNSHAGDAAAAATTAGRWKA